MLVRACLVATVCALAPVAWAAPADPTRTEARDRYERGKQLYEEHDYAGALAEFLRAQQLIPAQVTLLNIGRVYAALGRPVESVTAMDQVLANPGTLKPEQIQLATQTRDEQRRRVALVTVVTNVPAAVEIDGLSVGKAPLEQPLRVASGTHLVTVVAVGFLPARKEITVAGQASEEVKLELAPSEAKAAHLTVQTPLPDAEVVVDGQVVGRTPLAQSLTVMPGRREVELRRPGYVASKKDIALGDGASGALSFELEEAPDASAGQLALAISESYAQVTVDGRPRGVYQGSLRLPAGTHRLRVERGGFEPVERTATVPAGGEATVRVTLQPTAETRLAYVEKAQRQRVWGWSTVAAGAVVMAGGTALALVSQSKLGDARTDRNGVDAMYATGARCDPLGGGPHDQCDAERDAAQRKVNDLSLRRTLGFIGAGVGVAALATGAALLFTGENPQRYDHPDSDLAVTLDWRTGPHLTLSLRF